MIWDSQVFSSTKSDHKRVVQALKNISEGTNLEQAMEPTGYAVVFAGIIVKYRLLSLRAAIRKAAVVSRVIISII